MFTVEDIRISAKLNSRQAVHARLKAMEKEGIFIIKRYRGKSRVFLQKEVDQIVDWEGTLPGPKKNAGLV